jgi:peptide/nickel transport system permease protein
MYFVPGDPVSMMLGSAAGPADVQALREVMGLNEPYLVRLGKYLNQVFLHFDFGKSLVTQTSVTADIFERLPRTFLLAIVSIMLSLTIGVPLGIEAAAHQNGWGDRICMFLALFGVSMPAFWLGLMLVIVFALHLKVLPASGMGGIQYYILPALANSFGGIASQARQGRSSMLEVIRSDYISTARGKGLPAQLVLYKHALPNALIPIVTVAGTEFGNMLGGTLIIETVFSIPGIGNYMITAVNNRDYPVVQGCLIFLAIFFSVIMLIMDLTYAAINPQIKSQYETKKKRAQDE